MVTDVVAGTRFTATELLSKAVAIEKWSEHPPVKAIAQRAEKIKLPTATHFKAMVKPSA